MFIALPAKSVVNAKEDTSLIQMEIVKLLNVELIIALNAVSPIHPYVSIVNLDIL